MKKNKRILLLWILDFLAGAFALLVSFLWYLAGRGVWSVLLLLCSIMDFSFAYINWKTWRTYGK